MTTTHGRHRAPVARIPRRTRHTVAVGIVLMVALTIAAVMLGGTSQADTTPTAGKSAATVTKPAIDVADYDTLGRWPSDMTWLCVEDHAGRGWPVDEAVAEFDGIVAMDVRSDCSDARYVVEVHLAQMDRSNSAWFDTQRNDADEITRGRIRLNVDEAYRMDAHAWRMALGHELGHAVGLSHTHEGASIMDPHLYSTVDGLTRQDRLQLDQIYRR